MYLDWILEELKAINEVWSPQARERSAEVRRARAKGRSTGKVNNRAARAGMSFYDRLAHGHLGPKQQQEFSSLFQKHRALSRQELVFANHRQYSKQMAVIDKKNKINARLNALSKIAARKYGSSL